MVAGDDNDVFADVLLRSVRSLGSPAAGAR